jgi:hypothetical protein
MFISIYYLKSSKATVGFPELSADYIPFPAVPFQTGEQPAIQVIILTALQMYDYFCIGENGFYSIRRRDLPGRVTGWN